MSSERWTARDVERLLRAAMIAENVLFTDIQHFTDDLQKLNEVEPAVTFVRDVEPRAEGVVSVHLADRQVVYLSSRTRSGRGLYIRVAYVEGKGFVRGFAKSEAPGRATEQRFEAGWAEIRRRS